ncbi:hypothetical protein Tco_1386118, partial [Tanacetum coccineum]
MMKEDVGFAPTTSASPNGATVATKRVLTLSYLRGVTGCPGHEEQRGGSQ